MNDQRHRIIDVLERRYAEGADAEDMDRCPSYDYQAQHWTTADHAHLVGYGTEPLIYCGADAVTCRRGGGEGWS